MKIVHYIFIFCTLIFVIQLVITGLFFHHISSSSPSSPLSPINSTTTSLDITSLQTQQRKQISHNVNATSLFIKPNSFRCAASCSSKTPHFLSCTYVSQFILKLTTNFTSSITLGNRNTPQNSEIDYTRKSYKRVLR